MDIMKHLVESRYDLVEIEALTKSLGAEPTFEDIELVLRRRDTLVSRMKQRERQLSSTGSDWNERIEEDPRMGGPCEEAHSLLRSVADMDSVLASILESRMASIRQHLTDLYHSSRAAYSYMVQSLRPVR